VSRDGHIHVFARGDDRNIWHTFWKGTTWSGWRADLGVGTFMSGVVAVAPPDGSIHALAQGDDSISRGSCRPSTDATTVYYDGAEREFRGFRMVVQYDTNVIGSETHSPPMMTRTWFDLGPVCDEGSESRQVEVSRDYWSEDPSVLPTRATLATFLQSPP